MDAGQLINLIPQQAWWLFIWFSAFIENVFPPYPGDSVIVLGGYLLGADKIGFFSLASAVYTGNICGSLLMYYFGEHVLTFFRNRFKTKWVKEILDPDKIRKTENWFNRWGVIAVIFSRFSAGIRFFVAIVAGMARMNLLKFVVSFSIATFLWNSILIYGGYVLGENWRQLLDLLKVYNTIVFSLIAVAISGYVLYRWCQKKKAFAQNANPPVN